MKTNLKVKKSYNCRLTILLSVMLLVLLFGQKSTGQNTEEREVMMIQVYAENPFYWQYKGEPVMLLGASDYHNIFQRPDMVEELEMLEAAGGNYVRNSMASREIFPDHRDLWPFKVVDTCRI